MTQTTTTRVTEGITRGITRRAARRTATRTTRAAPTRTTRGTTKRITAHIALLAALLAAGSAAAEMTAEQAAQYMAASFPNVRVERVTPTPLAGVYEVVAGGNIYYLTHDGAFLLSGTLYDLKAGADLTERAYAGLRHSVADDARAAAVISYTPEKTRYTVTVLSDVNCAYCRKFHNQMARVNELGIRVNYLLIPFLGQKSRRDAISVWCADDRRTALDRAKNGAAIEQKDCDHPVDRNMRIAETLGVRGTPAFLLADGKLLNGYRTPENLLEEVKRAGAPARPAQPAH